MTEARLYETSAGRFGRRFEPVHEMALYPDALRAVSTLPGASSGVIVVPEMTGPIGIPDFLAVVGGRKQIASRISSGIPPITSELDVQLISRLHVSRPKRLETLVKESFMSEGAAKSRLRKLQQIGAAREIKPMLFVRSPDLTPGGRLYAIETKVRDYKRAIRQARGYRTWTSNYVIILGALGEKALAGATLETVVDRAGLMVDGQWIRKPVAEHKNSQRTFLAFEYLAAALTNPLGK